MLDLETSEILYNTTFYPNNSHQDDLNASVSSSLTSYGSGYIESILTLTLTAFDANGSIVECRISDLDFAYVIVETKSSGK